MLFKYDDNTKVRILDNGAIEIIHYYNYSENIVTLNEDEARWLRDVLSQHLSVKANLG